MGGRKSLSLKVAAEHFEGVLRGPEADALAVSGELELLDLGVFAIGEADVDEAYGLAFVGAGGWCGWAGEAGDADADGAASGCADALGERAGDFVADGSVLSEGFGRDVGESGLERVGVDDRSADEVAGDVGDRGEALGEQAAGAAFGGAEGEVVEAEHELDDFFERLAVGGEDVFAHLAFDEFG